VVTEIGGVQRSGDEGQQNEAQEFFHKEGRRMSAASQPFCKM
jgi:hypothetical protein